MFEHKLLFLGETFPPSIGGIQTYLSGVLAALPQEKTFVVASEQPGDQAWDRTVPYRVTRAPSRAWTYPRWYRFWQAARAAVQREHIEAVVCAKALFEGRAARRLQKEFGVPYIVCTYALEVLHWLRGRITRVQLLHVLRDAGRIVVINEEIRRCLLRLGIPEARLVKLYPGVAEAYFSTQRMLAEDGHPLCARLVEQGKRLVVSVGRLVPRKGHDVLIRAFADVVRRVPEAHVVIVGDGPERTRLERRAQSLGLEDSVTFSGALTSDEVRRALAVAEVVALTPVNLRDDLEGFGIVYLEAAAMGKPAVGSRVGGVPEAVLDGETGLLVPERDERATAEAIVRLLRDQGLRERLAGNARARADKEFHWKGRALVFQGMVHSLLSEQGTVSGEQPRIPVH